VSENKRERECRGEERERMKQRENTSPRRERMNIVEEGG